jgi:hypothetical protein
MSSLSDLEHVLAELQQNTFPPHIAELSVRDKVKRAFTLFERYAVTQPGGLFPTLPKASALVLKGLEFKKRWALNGILLTHIWWAFFFGPLYYFAVGMWRKGLVLICAMLVLSIVIDVLFVVTTGQEMSDSLIKGVGFGFAYAVSSIATYDLYRLKVKKETFWW